MKNETCNKRKNKYTGEVQEYAEFGSLEEDSANYCLEKLNKSFSKGYDFWVEHQPGTVKFIRNYKTK